MSLLLHTNLFCARERKGLRRFREKKPQPALEKKKTRQSVICWKIEHFVDATGVCGWQSVLWRWSWGAGDRCWGGGTTPSALLPRELLGLGGPHSPALSSGCPSFPRRVSLKAGMLRRRKTRPKGGRITCPHVSAFSKGLDPKKLQKPEFCRFLGQSDGPGCRGG